MPRCENASVAGQEWWQQLPTLREHLHVADYTAELQVISTLLNAASLHLRSCSGKYEGLKQLVFARGLHFSVSTKDNRLFCALDGTLGIREHERLVLGVLFGESTGWQVHSP